MTSQALFIVRFSADLSTKSGRTRGRFAQVLRSNILAALSQAGVRARIAQTHGRLFVFASDEARARAQLGRVFGIANFSHVTARCKADLDDMARTVEAHFARTVEGRRYAVRVRRTGHHPFNSVDVERHLGAVLNPHATVDLDNPEVTVHVEVLGNDAYFFTERVEGAGGLPLGSEGKAVALLSGGFDSAVAAWRIMRRGVAVDFLFCNLAGGAYERQVIQIAKVLTDMWAFGGRPRIFVIDFNEVVSDMKAHVDPALWQVVLKRLMYRAASSLAERLRAQAIVTGEALGQVSSQTLSNLSAIEPAADRLVLRPLVGLDKSEIMAQARHIGTALLSERIPEHCALANRSPAVRSTARAAASEEAKTEEQALKRAIAGMRQVDLATVTGADLRTDYLFVDEVPEGAQVIDCQPKAHYDRWHLPGAVNRSPESVIRDMKRFDKRHSYVLYCAFGTQSAHLAEIMQQYGYQAYALRGGIGAIRKRHDHGAEPA
ncbi:tRNA uracil 4-sulfurtransferase ThiI [Chelativorans sp. M5D2P16]|uniref:tRNA uracil 4-sulfurtransferase ThiI n=1 Tax=Chelativorans sp. M5D2P16 TaxID=3095678 RepID=UPI002ACAA9BA|nr:tRNA uracil 4-sulfurtransferase ThiI [Chelativorans sp. M5D2P16]MDZ5695695.1 tRNA uracil 4-sulfurtransferase ThiI [Chelativorans sp. M5D2P16]